LQSELIDKVENSTVYDIAEINGLLKKIKERQDVHELSLQEKAGLADVYLKNETYNQSATYSRAEADGLLAGKSDGDATAARSASSSSSSSGGVEMWLVIVIVVGVVVLNNVILYVVFFRGNSGSGGSHRKPKRGGSGSLYNGHANVVKNPLYKGGSKTDDALAKTLSRGSGDDDATYDYTGAGIWNAAASTEDAGYMAMGNDLYTGVGVSSTGLSVANPLFSENDNSTDMYMSVNQVSNENERMKAEIALMQKEMQQTNAGSNDTEGMYAMMPADGNENDTYSGIAPHNEDDELEDAYM
jgi:hypothetical protein